MATSPQRTWTAGQVAARLRIAESTLRAWHRRYGLGPHPAVPGQYRRYGPDDLARLTRMSDLISTGMSAADAAAASARPGPAPSDALAAVVRAARALDTGECAHHLHQSLTTWGVPRTWHEVCLPALATIDNDQRDDPDCLASEHALTWSITTTLHTVARPPAGPAPILLSCTESEHHSLGLEALAAALAERDIPARMLGAAMPTKALAHAIRTSHPATVVLWSHHPDTANPTPLRTLTRLTPRLLLAGPGWPKPPTHPARLTTLTEALDTLTPASEASRS